MVYVYRIPAGCTAIVAFKSGNQLFVANAGDSRGVLCRAGNVAYALSEDHKPQQVRLFLWKINFYLFLF